MILKILAIIALLLGSWIVLLNWHSIYATRKSGRFVSPVPLLGTLLLALGLLAFHRTRSYAWIAVLADYATLALIYSLPAIMRDEWQTSVFNLIHRFTCECNGRRDDIRLFKRSRFTIECRHEPPAPCDDKGDNGVKVSQYGFVGNWHEQADGFRLEGYAGERALVIRRGNQGYTTEETGYPPDRRFPYDQLDDLELAEVR